MKKLNATFRIQRILVIPKMIVLLFFGGIVLSVGASDLPSDSPVFQQQKRLITGTISDAKGNPIAGATITDSGTGNVAVSDGKGAFSIQASSADALSISFIGYVRQSVRVGNQNSIDVVMADELRVVDDIVVIGYGSVKRANLTGSVGYIGSREIENRSVPSITQAIQGKVAGVNVSTPSGRPGQAQSINLRGYTGININEWGERSNRSDGPLIVIDGIQGGNLTSLDMHDVESISFLKDAASAAIYGSSAPYGVVIVTTKKGRSGKPTISYNNNFGFSQPINLPTFMSSLDYAKAWNEVSENSLMPAFFPDDAIERIEGYLAGTIKDGTTPSLVADEWNVYQNANANTNWFDVYFKKLSFSQQHNLNLSGATDNSSYFASLGYMQRGGMYKFGDEKNRRFNARLNLTSKPTHWLSLGVRSAFSRTTLSGATAISEGQAYDFMHTIGRTFPTNPVVNPDGWYSQPSYLQDLVNGARSTSASDNVILTGEMVVTPLEGWEITGNFTYNGLYYNKADHGKNYNLLRPSGAITPAFAMSTMSRETRKNQLYTVNAFTSYERAFGSGHYFKAMLGYTQELDDRLSFTGKAEELYTDEIPMLGMSYGNRTTTDAATQLAIRGAFGRLNYNYKERYLVELNGRYDGTSRFLKDVRYKFYPGISAAWVVSKENFWEPLLRVVDQFKIRASYASLGDQSFTDSHYPFYPSLGVADPSMWGNQYYFGDGRGSSISAPGLVNYGLTWVTVNTFGVGVDLSMLGNRLNVTFDWYDRRARDFADFGAAVPSLLGAAAPRRNNAETSTKGWEITASWRDRVGQFSYGATLVLSDYMGKIVKYDNPDKLLNNLWYDGMTMGEIWGYRTVGLFKDQAEIDGTDQSHIFANWYPGDVHYADLNGDGKVDVGTNTVGDPGDRRIIGNNTPRYSFGLTLNAAWKGFDASLFIQGIAKRDFMFDSESNYYWGFVNGVWNSSYYTSHTDRWREDKTDGFFPRAYFNTNKNRQSQTRYLENAAYLRVKNLQIGYSLPGAITDRIKFSRLRVFVNIENLATWTRLPDIIDPEVVSADAKVYPLSRTWAFGVNVTF